MSSRGDVGADNEGPALDESVSWTGGHGRGARGRDLYNLGMRCEERGWLRTYMLERLMDAFTTGYVCHH